MVFDPYFLQPFHSQRDIPSIPSSHLFQLFCSDILSPPFIPLFSLSNINIPSQVVYYKILHLQFITWFSILIFYSHYIHRETYTQFPAVIFSHDFVLTFFLLLSFLCSLFITCIFSPKLFTTFALSCQMFFDHNCLLLSLLLHLESIA